LHTEFVHLTCVLWHSEMDLGSWGLGIFIQGAFLRWRACCLEHRYDLWHPEILVCCNIRV